LEIHVDPILVDKKDGCCRECKGQLEIIDASMDDMEVECTECGESYTVEIDAFHDGGVTYWPEAMANKMEAGEDE
jgi:hypothetical protein